MEMNILMSYQTQAIVIAAKQSPRNEFILDCRLQNTEFFNKKEKNNLEELSWVKIHCMMLFTSVVFKERIERIQNV